jgi:hypothetical protein
MRISQEKGEGVEMVMEVNVRENRKEQSRMEQTQTLAT